MNGTTTISRFRLSFKLGMKDIRSFQAGTVETESQEPFLLVPLLLVLILGSVSESVHLGGQTKSNLSRTSVRQNPMKCLDQVDKSGSLRAIANGNPRTMIVQSNLKSRLELPMSVSLSRRLT